jgi:anti-sigma regulatory factor (Ser/Thr protein kinase)
MVAAAVHTSPPGSRYLDVDEPVATSPARVRRRLRAAFAQWELPAEAAENALIVVEELVANVVDHARTPFRLTVHHLRGDHTGPSLRIAVRDGCPQPLNPRPIDVHAVRGRGLQLIEALTSRWGCHRTSAGKTVWAVLPA